MNVGEYITSGILQDHCLGLLNDEEEKLVELMCHSYPKVAKELQLLSKGLESFVGSHETVRRQVLRMAVWESVKKIWEE